jgi:LacI family transcriptional regulator
MSKEAPVDASQHRVTIAEVATFAGVSPTTVSHVLSGKRAVGAGTKVAVLEAIQQLGYRPNSVARSLRTRRSHMVAVIVPDITNPFYSTLIRGLADELDGSGYGTYVGNTDARPAREQAFLDDALDRGVDGMVFASTSVATRPEDGPAGTGTPVVCVGGAFDHPSVDLVTPDDEVGSRVAVAHLVARGATRIAMIQGPAESGTARDHGYRHALTDAGLDFRDEFMVRGDWTRRGGRRAMQQLMMLPERPDAVFCANDLTAIGAMDVARDLGVSIPADVAIAGFDDIDAASMVHPTLTTVQNPGYDTGRGAGRLLVSRMTSAYTGAGRTVVLPCQLVVREST